MQEWKPLPEGGRELSLFKIFSANIEEIEKALREAGFSNVSYDHHFRNPWISVLAKKQFLCQQERALLFGQCL